MIICGIETSCDETSVGFFDTVERKFFSCTSSQIDIHSLYGGVVPEIASRNHTLNIRNIFNEALKLGNIDVKDINLIGVTYSPGLIGALFVGVSFAKGISYGLNVPLIGINHLMAHILSAEINNDIEPPYLGMVISGGHTHIFKVDSCYNFYLLAKTLDDAVGETFDKVAKYMGLPYPGGPEIERLAVSGNEMKINFPIAMKNEINFSFSGLKTNVINTIQSKKYKLEDIAASFQRVVVLTIADKINKAIKLTGIKDVVVSGGVACNGYIRDSLRNVVDGNIFFPTKKLCTDNGDMIAYATYKLYRKKKFFGFGDTAVDSV